MINLKKIVAVALSAAMCLGLSMTAFAVDSPITPQEAVADKCGNGVLSADDISWVQSYDDGTYAFGLDVPGLSGVVIQSDSNGDLWWKSGVTGRIVSPGIPSAAAGWVRVLAGNQFADYYELVNGSYYFAKTEDGSLAINHTWLDDTVTDQFGNRIESNYKKLTAQSAGIGSATEIRDILLDAGYDIPASWTIIPVAADRITLDGSMPTGGAYAWVNVEELGAEVEGYVAGQTIQILRETRAGSGEWEVVDATLVECENGLRARVELTNRDQSLVVLRIMSDGKSIAVVNRKTGDRTIVPVTPGTTAAVSNAASASAAAPQASPKTGEF